MNKKNIAYFLIVGSIVMLIYNLTYQEDELFSAESIFRIFWSILIIVVGLRFLKEHKDNG